MIVGLLRGRLAVYSSGESYGQNKDYDAQEGLETPQGKRQGCAQGGREAYHGEKGKIEASAFGRSCSKVHNKKTAAIEVCRSQSIKENAGPIGRGAGQGHDHRRDR